MNEALKLVDFLPVAIIEDVVRNCELNDQAHKADHVFGVVLQADKYIQRFQELRPYREIILTAALMHDNCSNLNRPEHHILGARYAANMFALYAPDMFDAEELSMICLAILEHRASWKKDRSNLVSDAVASADRGTPNLVRMIKRAMMYRFSEIGEPAHLTQEQVDYIIDGSVAHIREKYGLGGYAWDKTPSYYRKMFSHQIEDIQAELCGSLLDTIRHCRVNVYKWCVKN